jgi:hypothetical protein
MTETMTGFNPLKSWLRQSTRKKLPIKNCGRIQEYNSTRYMSDIYNYESKISLTKW